MSKKPVFTVMHRVVVDPITRDEVLTHTERTEDIVIFPGGERMDRLTFRGVPARLVDVSVSLPQRDGEMEKAWVCEVGRKVGRYDAEERLRINIRLWSTYRGGDPADHVGPLPKGRLSIVRAADLLLVALTWGDTGWAKEFPTLRSSLDGYDISRIVWWHWNRFYQHLSSYEVDPLAKSFEARKPEFVAQGLTLAEANRMASRNLYSLSRSLGWRKMTLREREKFGFTGTRQWYREEEINRRRVDMGYSPMGVGEYTLDAANGRVMRPVEEDRVESYDGEDTIQTSYGRFSEE